MANTKSASKRARQNERRTLRNRRVLTRLRSLNKQTNGAEAKPADLTTNTRALISSLDKAVKRGILHRNTARRRKARLNKALVASTPAK